MTIMNTGKRQFRELSDETKGKISASTTGRPKTAQHRANISKGMQEYWKTIPNRPQPSTGATTTPENNGGME